MVIYQSLSRNLLFMKRDRAAEGKQSCTEKCFTNCFQLRNIPGRLRPDPIRVVVAKRLPRFKRHAVKFEAARNVLAEPRERRRPHVLDTVNRCGNEELRLYPLAHARGSEEGVGRSANVGTSTARSLPEGCEKLVPDLSAFESLLKIKAYERALRAAQADGLSWTMDPRFQERSPWLGSRKRNRKGLAQASNNIHTGLTCTLWFASEPE